MLARDYLSLYLSERDVSAEYKADLAYSLKLLDRWAGHAVTLSELSDDLGNRWLAALQTCMRPRSVKHHRTNLLSVWRGAAEAAEAGLTDVWPRRVRRIKVPYSLPQAWSVEEMRRVLLATQLLTGCFRRVKVLRAAFWRAYVLLGWNTGLRPSDLWRLELAEIGTNGVMIHVAHKTGEVIAVPLWPETVAAVEAIRLPDRPRIFGAVLGLEAIRRQFKRLAKSAGLNGTPKKIRKSASTAVESQEPGAASGFLGHRSIEMARRHYVDPRLLPNRRPLPPPLAS